MTNPDKPVATGLKRFDQRLLRWAEAYPSISRDRRAINILFGVKELLLLGRIGVDLATGQPDMLPFWIAALAATLGFHAAFNVIMGLAESVKTLARVQR
jgi:hypothetical protein